MNDVTLIVLVIGFLGALLLRMAFRQLRSGIAWSPIGRLWKPITRAEVPLVFWLAVAINILHGAVLTLVPRWYAIGAR